jgi:hypothetical protein
MAVKKTERTRTNFTYRIDTWAKPEGKSIVEHVAGVEDYQLALATFRAACERWPNTPITLRQGARVIGPPGPVGPAGAPLPWGLCYGPNREIRNAVSLVGAPAPKSPDWAAGALRSVT